MMVLDASALLAFLFKETGHEQVAPEVSGGCMSSVNLAEVLGRFTRDGHDPLVISRRIRASGLEIVDFTVDDAAMTAALRRQTDQLGLSLGDRACLALAVARGLPAMSADRQWSSLNLPVAVHIIR